MVAFKCLNDSDGSMSKVSVVFVCMGNICRSPTAEGVFQQLVNNAGLQDHIGVDSAGTHSYHIGSGPDRRSQATARARGIDLSRLRARRFEADDFHQFDYVIGMDRENRLNMEAIRPDDSDRPVHLMLDFSNKYNQQREVPDPYFGDDGFDLVFDMVEDAARGLLAEIREREGF